MLRESSPDNFEVDPFSPPPPPPSSQVLVARERQAELWSELGLTAPSQARLDTIGRSLRKAMSGADDVFSHLLRLNPSAVPIMRRYATFLAEVSCSLFHAHEEVSRLCCAWYLKR